MTETALRQFEERLGHHFRDQRLLERALTHASAVGDGRITEHNERLEFLGDRVLGLVAAEYVYAAAEDAPEGTLARALNRLVRKETCAQVAQRLEMGRVLVMARGEDRAGGREKPGILADACEAVLGAVHLDGGLQPVRQIFAQHWPKDDTELSTGVKDAKSMLQEWVQGRGHPPPVYEVVDQTGPDHRPEFTVEVRVEGLASEKAQAGSKREAEQAAAEAMLARERIS
jgi:ribonuclease-3